MKILKNIFSVAATNIINFGTSFIIGFILPSVLSVADYGNYRQYILYMSFSYLFNMGFNDGIYIKYGGKEDSELDAETVRDEHIFIFVFQFIVFLVMFAYAIWQNSIIFGFFSIATLVNSITVYHQNFLQATGKFNIFSRANILKSIFNIITLLIAIFLMQSANYVVYIAIHALSIVFIFLLYEFHFVKKYGISRTVSPKGKFDIFRVGFFVLIANMSLTFVGNAGSWIVNWGYSIEDFAQYSFQNSILNVILLIVSAVGMVFYNVISKRQDEELMNIIKNVSIYLGIGAGLGFFVFKVIIEMLLPEYVSAISLLSITFIAIPYIMLSKILIANLYKATVPERKYFVDSISYAGLSFVFVFVFNLLFGSMQAIAFATTLCYIFWFLYTSRTQFTFLKNTQKENLLLISHFVVFLFATNYLPTVAGFVTYLIYLIIIFFSSKKEINAIVNLLKN